MDTVFRVLALNMRNSHTCKEVPPADLLFAILCKRRLAPLFMIRSTPCIWLWLSLQQAHQIFFGKYYCSECLRGHKATVHICNAMQCGKLQAKIWKICSWECRAKVAHRNKLLCRRGLGTRQHQHYLEMHSTCSADQGLLQDRSARAFFSFKFCLCLQLHQSLEGIYMTGDAKRHNWSKKLELCHLWVQCTAFGVNLRAWTSIDRSPQAFRSYVERFHKCDWIIIWI